MEMLDGSVIATALPQMAQSFHENPVNLSIGMSAYLLTLAIFIPASGWIADRFGSKTIFLSAIVVFTVASVLCGICNTLPEFTAARVLQGMGGAMMVPVGRLVVLRTSEKRELVGMMQMISTPGLIAPILGPPVGGFITTFSSWRWIFFLNVPIGILGVALVAAFMVNHTSDVRRSFDWTGFFLTGAGLASLLFGIDQLGRPNAGITVTAGLIAAGAAICALAYVHLQRATHPLLDLTLFRIPTFAITTLMGGTAFRIVIGSTPFLWPLLFQVGFGLSAFASGGLIFACAAGDFMMKFFSKRVLQRFGFRRTLFFNGLLVALAILACTAFSAATPLVVIALVLFLIGIVRSVQFGSFNALTYGDISPERMSAANSLAATIQQLSFGVGIAFGLHLAQFVNGNRGEGFTVGDFRVAFVAAAALAALSAVAFRRLAPDAGAETSGHKPKEAVSPAALAG
jgi:EmrB/QacA subfamily drug resistance transporter